MEPHKLTKSATDRKRQKIRQRNRKILGNLGIENGNSVCLRRKKRKGSPEFHVNIDLEMPMISRNYNDPYNTVNYPYNHMQNDPYFNNDPYNQNQPYFQPDPFNHLDPYLNVKDPYLQNNNNYNNNNYYHDNNCNEINRVIFWRDDVITLTGHLIKTVESLIQVPGLVLTEFHRGNDQINIGYTDKGLVTKESKDIINFSELGTQLAYIYRFFPGHVLILGELLLSSSGWSGIRFPPSKSPLVRNLAKMNTFLDSLSDHVSVMCFGGGPVSEVAAITAWLRNEGVYQPVQFDIVDKYSAWNKVAAEVGTFCNVELSYRELDFLTCRPEELAQCSSMDIVCMSKFLSALTAHRAAATPSLAAVLQHMKPGAILIYIDNSGGGTTQWLTTEAHKANFTEVFSIPHYPARLDPAVLAPNERRSLFKVKATSTLNVAFKVFRKGGGFTPNFYQPSFREKMYVRVGQSCTSWP